MYCRNCGKEVHEKAVACPACGVPPLAEGKFCPQCGAPTQPSQVMCVKCGSALTAAAGRPGTKSKVAAGLLGIFLGALGIHKFYLGYNKPAVIMLLISLVGGLVTSGIAAWVVAVIGLIEGIIYLTKSDADFEAIYVRRPHHWF